MDNWEEVKFTRDIPVKYNVDVFVAGGGPSGVAAAVTAARSGRSVYLAENEMCFGGMGTSGGVPAFMTFSDGEHFLAAGVGEEIYNMLKDAGGTGPDDAFAIKAEVLKRVYDKLVKDAGVDFTFQTKLIGVEKEDDKVKYAVLASKSGIFAVKAKMFIDCTGDGDLAAWAKAPYEKGDGEGNMMAGTLCALWADIDWDKVRQSHINQGAFLEQAFEDNIFTVKDRHLSGIWRVGDTLGGSNIGHAYGVDGTDEVSLTKAMVEQRQRLIEFQTYYKKYLKGFEDMEMVTSAALMGIRESRRIIGDYVLTVEDFKSRASFDDEIGRYCYPVDIHASKPDLESYKKFEKDFKELRYKKGESYGVPYRILVPKNLSNVLTAGRCVSCDRAMEASIRVMPGCYITGQAAGYAASIAIEENTDARGFDVKKLQKRIKDAGGYLPNYK